jgi:glycosyltransferase involved in cell wall biosynthesis
MRVLHVMWRMSIGGAERAVYQLVREQRRRGTEADVAVAGELGIYGERLREAGALVHELGCRHALDLRGSRRLTRLAREYDIVHHHGIEPLLLAASMRARSPRLVYTHRGGIREHGWRKRLRLRVAKPYVRQFPALSGNTRQSARVLARFLGIPDRDVAVVYNGLDFALLAPDREPEDVRLDLPAWPHGSFLVGTAANLQPLKRVHLLLEAVGLLDEPLVHCLVLGDGPERASLEELADKLGLRDRVSFLGRIDHVGDYLQLLDAFVLPSGPEEAFGNAAVEAMGVGIPTVVFADGGGLVEHVRDRETGHIVRGTDELVAVLRELAANPGSRLRLGEAGRQYAQITYSLDAMFERYEALYLRAMAVSR